MTTAAVVMTQAAYAYSDSQRENAFWNAGYAFCDAEKLGQYWGMPTYRAKLWAGKKILLGLKNGVDAALDEALTAHIQCPDGFNYHDSIKLGELWTMPHQG